MNRPVYLTGAHVTGPHIRGIADLAALLTGDTARFRGDTKGASFDSTSPFYPQKSDLKSMRDDVIAAVICVSELLEMEGIKRLERESIPLYITTGISLGELDATINLLKDTLADSKRNGLYGSLVFPELFYPALPPLTALRTLTNVIESFVSLYTGLAGDNTTFGSTSAAGFYALKEAWHGIASGENEIAVVGGAAIGEKQLPIMFRNFTSASSGWRSSTCAVFFILESREGIEQRQKQPLAELVDLLQSTRVPQLLNFPGTAPYSELTIVDSKRGYYIFGGGLTDDTYRAEKDTLKKRGLEAASLHPALGNTGSASLLMSLAAALSLQPARQSDRATCLESDPYEREFSVQLRYTPMGNV